MITKELTQDEMKKELAPGGLLAKISDERPHLAMHVLNGHTAFTIGGTTIVRKGSQAAHSLRNPTPTLVTRDVPAAIEERSVPAPPRPSPTVAEPKPAAKAATHARIAGLEGNAEPTPILRAHRSQSRLEAHRADQAARSVGHVHGKAPTKLAERLGKLGGAA